MPYRERLFYIAAAFAAGMLFWWCAGAFGAEPPRFEVVNKVPPAFMVVNRLAPEPAAPAGWQWWVDATGKKWLVKVEANNAGAPAVAPRTFPGGGYHAGHQCPQCGRNQFVIAGHNADGTHSHRCAFDGTVWRH